MDTMNHSDLSFVTNEGSHNLYERFRELIKDTKNFDVLVGYFYLSGFHLIYKSLEKTAKIRILIGIDADKKVKELYSVGKTEMEEALSHKIQKDMDESEDNIDVEEGVKKFLEWLGSGKLEIRAYKERNIHAKLYIMTFNEGDRDAGRVITGSSNFTASGMKENIEFNVELKDRSDYEFSKEKFQELWDHSDTFDMGILYQDYVPNKTWLRQNITPYELYLKFLYEYFKEELNQQNTLSMEDLPDNYESYEYQKEAVLNANRILKQYGGVFISDVVGLGKTFIVALLLKNIQSRRRVLVIAPPALVDEKNPGSWINVLHDFGVPARCRSWGKLDSLRNLDSEYDYVVIDEAHRFRNEDTGTYEKVAEICRSSKVILISATPLNNSPRDLLNLIKLFQSPKSSTIPGIVNLNVFFNLLENNIKTLDKHKDLAKYLEVTKNNANLIRERVLKHIIVRRTRKEIEDYYQDDMKKEGIRFPKVNDPQPVFYQLNMIENKIFNHTIDIITKRIKYARYQPIKYYTGEQPEIQSLLQSEHNLVGFMKTMLVKRLESSFYAFKKSVNRFIRIHESFIQGMEKGDVFTSKKYYAKLMEALESDNDEAIEQLIAEGKVNAYPIDDFNESLKQDVSSDLEHLKNLQQMWQDITRDPKIIELKEILANNDKLKDKVIIFTESKETAEYIKGEMESIYPKEAILFTGASKQGVRSVVLENFDANHKGQKNDYRILISTEVLSEGVNMHRSNAIINYDIPWNPARLMQRAGRVNRINTKFDDINIFNFFPSEEGNNEIQLQETAMAKIELFISTLGADAQTLTEGEVIESHELFYKKLISKDTITGEKEEHQSSLKYFNVIKKIRDNDDDLYNQIINLPKKARTAKRFKGEKNQLLTYFRKNKNIQKFFLAIDSSSKEIDFMEAAKLLESDSTIQSVRLLDDFYEQLNYNKNCFAEETNEDNGYHTKSNTTGKGNSNERKLYDQLKYMRDAHPKSSHQQHISKIIGALDEGLLPPEVIRRSLKKLKDLKSKHGSSNLDVLVNALKDNISAKLMASHQATSAKEAGSEEVILSEYFIAN